MSDGKFLWYWGYGEEPEACYGGENTREAILQVARLEADGEGFTIVEADKSVAGFDCFDADNVLEQYEDRNEECWGEDGPDFPPINGDVKRELETALAATLKAWMDKHDCHGRAWRFGTERYREYFPPEEEPAK